MKFFSDVVLKRANQLLAASKGLDYDKIRVHDNDEISKLRAVLERLNIPLLRPEPPLAAPTDLQTPSASIINDDAFSLLDDLQPVYATTGSNSQKLPLDYLLVAIQNEGLGENIGYVFDSESPDRRRLLDDVSHRHGLPGFDLVLAPQNSTVAGLHGIFVSGQQIVSASLTSGDAWQIVERESYRTESELIGHLKQLC